MHSSWRPTNHAADSGSTISPSTLRNNGRSRALLSCRRDDPPGSLNGLPPGDFPLSIFDTVINGITVRGSIVGTRLDLQEALNFAGEGKIKATIATETLDNINDVFVRMHQGDIQGRVVIDFQK